MYAVLRGSDPANASRIVLVTGHYDSRNSETNDATGASPGANDDGSGTAVSLECARVLSQHSFPATIIFLAVAGEEQGLYGSAHFAKMAKAQGWNIEAVLNNDIVGGDRTPGDRAGPAHRTGFLRGHSGERQRERVEDDSRAGRRKRRRLAPTGTLHRGGVEASTSRRRSFIRWWCSAATAICGVATTLRSTSRDSRPCASPNTARTTTTSTRTSAPRMASNTATCRSLWTTTTSPNVARVNAATLASLASAPAPPAKVRVLTKALQNDSTLVWEPSPGGLATGYLVLWRDTGAPDWEHAQAFGNVTQATLPVSKDNVIFAVQATDAKGHRSLPVVPAPER